MKIVKIIGGLGNQMFQYAFYEMLKFHFYDEEIYIDPSQFYTYKLHNGFELPEVFLINPLIADYSYVKKLSYNSKWYYVSRVKRKLFGSKRTEYIEKSDFIYDENILLQSNTNMYYEGYWQNPIYFKNIEDVLREKFTFKKIDDEININMLTFIESTNSVSIHVRRGDYLNNPLYNGICNEKYYIKSIEHLKESVKDPVFFVFSNDVEWCENNFNEIFKNQSVYYVNWNFGGKSFIDLNLMSKCKHNIIANSSFSWWAAWLNSNPSKIVITPDRWMNNINDEIGLITIFKN